MFLLFSLLEIGWEFCNGLKWNNGWRFKTSNNQFAFSVCFQARGLQVGGLVQLGGGPPGVPGWSVWGAVSLPPAQSRQRHQPRRPPASLPLRGPWVCERRVLRPHGALRHLRPLLRRREHRRPASVLRYDGRGLWLSVGSAVVRKSLCGCMLLSIMLMLSGDRIPCQKYWLFLRLCWSAVIVILSGCSRHAVSVVVVRSLLSGCDYTRSVQRYFYSVMCNSAAYSARLSV